MGYDHVNLITRLLGDMAKPHQNLNHLPPGPPLDRLASLLRLSPKEVTQRTIHQFAHALVLQPAGASPALLCDPKTALRYWEAQIAPVCSACLAESPPYERLIWCFRPLQICTTHATPLLRRCPACGRPSSPSRKELVRCRCGNLLADGGLKKVSAETLAHCRTLEQWLQPDVQPLPALAGAASWWLAERLAAAIGNTPNWVRGASERLAIDPVNAPDLLRWTAVVEIFAAWPDRWFQFLDAYQAVPKIRNLSTGVGRSFGFLLRDVVQLESLGFPGPAEALRQYLLERYHAGHVNQKLVLFQRRATQPLVQERPWFTQTEAAKVLQMRPRRITALIRQGVIEGQVLPAGNRGRTVGLVSKDSVLVLQRVLTTGLGIREASRRLGIGRSRIFELIRSRLLGPALRTHHGWSICQESVQSLQAFIRDYPRSISTMISGCPCGRQPGSMALPVSISSERSTGHGPVRWPPVQTARSQTCGASGFSVATSKSSCRPCERPIFTSEDIRYPSWRKVYFPATRAVNQSSENGSLPASCKPNGKAIPGWSPTSKSNAFGSRIVWGKTSVPSCRSAHGPWLDGKRWAV